MILWGCFVASGTGSHDYVHGIMNKEYYVDILKDNVTKSAASVTSGHCWVFPQENNLRPMFGLSKNL